MMHGVVGYCRDRDGNDKQSGPNLKSVAELVIM